MVVLVDIHHGEDRSRNVYGLTRGGELLWRVQALPADPDARPEPFRDIYIAPDGTVCGRTSGGKLYRISHADGRLTPA